LTEVICTVMNYGKPLTVLSINPGVPESMIFVTPGVPVSLLPFVTSQVT